MLRRLLSLAVGGLAVGAMLVSTTGVVAAATPHQWFVDDDGKAGASGCKGNLAVPTSIQAAIDVASPGDEVRVCPGTYVERLNIHTERLDVSGVKPWAATLKAPATNVAAGSTLVDIHDAEGVGVFWLNLVFPTAGPCVMYGDAIRVTRALGVNIQQDHIGISGSESSGCGYRNGVDAISGAHALIFRDEIADFRGTGVIAVGAYDWVRENVIKFMHPHLTAGAITSAVGIDVSVKSGQQVLLVTNNTIKSASTAGSSTPMLATGIFVHNIAVTLTANTISYADTAIQLRNSNGGSAFANTAVTGIASRGMVIDGSTNFEIANNHFAAQIVGIAATSGSTGNNIHDNDARGPSKPDCTDATSGSGTSGTANTWTNNTGTSSPTGLCTP